MPPKDIDNAWNSSLQRFTWFNIPVFSNKPQHKSQAVAYYSMFVVHLQTFTFTLKVHLRFLNRMSSDRNHEKAVTIVQLTN